MCIVKNEKNKVFLNLEMNKIEKILDKICRNDFSCSDVGLLFVLLRSYCKDNPILYDLTNFVAHNDSRNQGASFEYIRSYIENIIDVSRNGGTIFENKPVFNEEHVIEELIKTLRYNKFQFDENCFARQGINIVDCLIALMVETEIELKDIVEVKKCLLKMDEKKLMFHFNIVLCGPRINAPDGVNIQAEIFERKQPLVSIIVPTKNSHAFLRECLESIKQQTYPHIELIVVDNHSTDATQKIAREYTDKVFTQGPERSAQVNFGVGQAHGEFVYKVDSDFILDKEVVGQCVQEAAKGFDAVVVHNSPDVRISWIAKIRKFEVDMYKYDITHSSARFVKKEVYQKIGGFNEEITAGEDYDFQNKLNRNGFKTGFIDAEALHLGEPTHFWRHMKKYYDYGKDFVHYAKENKEESSEQLGFFRGVYVRNWKKFLSHPFLGIGFVFYSLFKFGFGGMGYFINKVRF